MNSLIFARVAPAVHRCTFAGDENTVDGVLVECPFPRAWKMRSVDAAIAAPAWWPLCDGKPEVCEHHMNVMLHASARFWQIDRRWNPTLEKWA